MEYILWRLGTQRSHDPSAILMEKIDWFEIELVHVGGKIDRFRGAVSASGTFFFFFAMRSLDGQMDEQSDGSSATL
jgi:hypothetical protein